MKQYKKRTVALILASVITVVGAFGADKYKNSLMSLKFESDSNGAVNMTLFTKSNYASPINAVKKDRSTYIIMLPETNCERNIPKEIDGSINSVDIRTMPYTTSSKGYTKIIVKTPPNTPLNTKKAVYIPNQKPVEQIASLPEQELRELIHGENSYDTAPNNISSKLERVNPKNKTENNFSDNRLSSNNNAAGTDKKVREIEPAASQVQNSENTRETKYVPPKAQQEDTNTYERVLYLLGLIFVITCVVFFYIKGKNKMAEILGEQNDFDINDKDEAEKKNKTKAQKIRSTINNIDKMYQKPVTLPKGVLLNNPPEAQPVQTQDDYADEPNVVDLDELFQEKSKESASNVIEENPEDNSSDDLSDFLSAFSFESEEESKAEVEQQELFNEELFESLIKNDKIKFSEADISKINELLNTEINDDTMKNLSKFVVTNPVESKRPSHTEILENFITSYTISQNITFTSEDIADLSKLISVEIDPDFISDLKTDPQKVQEMRKEIENNKIKAHRHSEILTLSVKDMLPDLSEELKKQGGKPIESNAKPEVVYFSEGYEVSTLSLQEKMPDLAAEVNNNAAYVSRPSDEVPMAESGYSYEKLSVNDELKDISITLEETEKEEKAEIKPEADEKALMQSIANVTFKPFYDGSESFEIVNDFEEDDKEEIDETEVRTVSDVQKELSKFEDFTVISEDEEKENKEASEDFTYEVLPVDVIEEEEVQETASSTAEPEPKTFYNLDREVAERNIHKKDANAQELLRIIEEQQEERKRKIQALRESKKNALRLKAEKQAETIEKALEVQNSEDGSCIVDHSKCVIIISTPFTNKSGCSLAKNADGEYIVFGYIGDRKIKLKQYKNIKIEKLETRVRAKLVGGGEQHIIKIGLHKFILNVYPDNMEFVMDLC